MHKQQGGIGTEAATRCPCVPTPALGNQAMGDLPRAQSSGGKRCCLHPADVFAGGSVCLGWVLWAQSSSILGGLQNGVGWGIVVSRQAAEFFPALVVPRELLGTPVWGAQPRCRVQLGGIPATPYSFRCRVSESHTSPLRPKGCHTEPNTSGCHGAALQQEGNVFSCTRGKISAGSDCCQLGTAPQSTQVPLQPSFGELTRCLGTLPEAAADVVVGPGTLGQSSSIPAAPSPRLSPKKHLAWTFPEGVFPGQLSPFSGLINARGSGPGDKALKPSQNMERTCPEIIPVMGQWGVVRWDGEKMSPKGLTAGQHCTKAEL